MQNTNAYNNNNKKKKKKKKKNNNNNKAIICKGCIGTVVYIWYILDELPCPLQVLMMLRKTPVYEEHLYFNNIMKEIWTLKVIKSYEY